MVTGPRPARLISGDALTAPDCRRDAGRGPAFGGVVNLTAAVAPETGTTFTLRLRTNVPTGNPGFVVAIASDTGRSAATAVANR